MGHKQRVPGKALQVADGSKRQSEGWAANPATGLKGEADSYALGRRVTTPGQAFMLPSFNGQDSGLSIRQLGFDSPREYQFASVTQWTRVSRFERESRGFESLREYKPWRRQNKAAALVRVLGKWTLSSVG